MGDGFTSIALFSLHLFVYLYHLQDLLRGQFLSSPQPDQRPFPANEVLNASRRARHVVGKDKDPPWIEHSVHLLKELRLVIGMVNGQRAGHGIDAGLGEPARPTGREIEMDEMQDGLKAVTTNASPQLSEQLPIFPGSTVAHESGKKLDTPITLCYTRQSYETPI